MQAPAPASTVIGPAVRQALTGPAVVHLDLVLGLHALCTADGGPEYGMPVSYRVLPAVWKPARAGDGHWGLFTADFTVMGLVDALRRPELRERHYELLGGVGPVLTLQLRVCELTTRSAEVHGQGAEEERRGEEGVRGAAGGTLRHVMTPEAAVGIGFDAHLAVQWLLGECWEQQEQQQQGQQWQEQRGELPAREPGGSGGHQAAGAGSRSQVASQAPEALVAQEPAGREEGLAAGEDGREHAGVGPLEAAQAVPGGVRVHERRDATAADARTLPGGTAEDASGGDVAAGMGSREPEGAAGAEAAGALPRAGGQVYGPGQRSRRPLSARALRSFEVRWWRSVCRAAEHMVPLRVGPEEDETVQALRRNLVGWLRMEELQLPNPIEGSLSPTPPARLAAALDGGLLPCLERLVRRAARDPEGSCSRLVQKVLSPTNPAANSYARWYGLLLLFAYGEEGQSTRVLSALASLLPRPGGGGGGGTSRHGSKGNANEVGMSGLAQFAVTVACALLGYGVEVWAHSDPPEGGSGSGSGGSGSGSGTGGGSESRSGGSRRATCPPGVPPPGRRRLQRALAHAARLLLPPLARFVCFNCGGTDHGQQGRATASTPSAQQRAAARARGFAAGALGPVLSWLMSLALMGLDGSCGGAGGKGGGGNSSGGPGGRGSGGSRDSADSDCSAGSSTRGTASHTGLIAGGDYGNGRTRAADQPLPQQQQHHYQQEEEEEEEEEAVALRAVHDTALRRFLFEEVQVVELVGAVLRHLPSLNACSDKAHALATVLVHLTVAYPAEVRPRVVGAVEGCKDGGRSLSGSGRAAGGARKERGASGAAAGCSSQPDSVWPVELVRGLGAQATGDDARGLDARLELAARRLEVWRDGGREGAAVAERAVMVVMDDDMAETSVGMMRAVHEVLSSPAAPLVA